MRELIAVLFFFGLVFVVAAIGVWGLGYFGALVMLDWSIVRWDRVAQVSGVFGGCGVGFLALAYGLVWARFR